MFDYSNLRKNSDSFLDSIIVELCFPQGVYPKAILYRILHDAVDESPREARRFPQALWDAVGDLAVSPFHQYFYWLKPIAHITDFSRVTRTFRGAFIRSIWRNLEETTAPDARRV